MKVLMALIISIGLFLTARIYLTNKKIEATIEKVYSVPFNNAN